MRDSHKSRSVRSLSVHACSAPVHELTELRSRPELWQRVHAARLMPGQKELVVVLDPPVAATCLSVSCIPPVPPPVMLREGFCAHDNYPFSVFAPFIGAITGISAKGTASDSNMRPLGWQCRVQQSYSSMP